MITHRTFFGDAERDFTLGFDQILELQRKTGAGIGSLFRRVAAGDFSLEDITETIRLALIGGGTEPKEAAALIAAYVAPRPIEHAMILATEILSARCFGVPAAPVEEADDTAPVIAEGGSYADLVNVLASEAAS